MKKNKAIIASIVTLSIFTGCNLDNTIPVDELIERKDILLTRSELDFIQENNGFALDLFKKVSENEEGKSLILSPLSVTIDLGMVNNGAGGETLNEINEVLGYKDGAIEGLNSFCQSMLKQSSEVDPSTTLEIANAAIINKNLVPLKDDFSNTIKSVYDAEVLYKDFANEDVKGLINNWCNKKTHGMIPKLLDVPMTGTEYANFLNAVYFKGIWSHKFKKSDTSKEMFTLEDGSQIKVDMMHQKSGFRMGGFNGLFTAITLPYGNEAYRMTILLPNNGKSLDNVKEILDAESWKEMTDYLNRTAVWDIDVKIPSFETEYTVELRQILDELGIKKAFGEDADFSGMTDLSVHIDRILHKAKIKVDEQGSEATAVVNTAILGGMSLTPGDPPTYEFHADRPFIYAITEVSTDAIFFIGQHTGK